MPTFALPQSRCLQPGFQHDPFHLDEIISQLFTELLLGTADHLGSSLFNFQPHVRSIKYFIYAAIKIAEYWWRCTSRRA